MINVLLVDDHAMMREGVKRIMAHAADVHVVAELADGTGVLETLGRIRCDVIVLDLNMPNTNGLDVMRRIRNAGLEVPVLVLSMHNSREMVEAALSAGANGFLTKDFDPASFVNIVRAIARGEKFIDGRLAASLLLENGGSKKPHEMLSGRETQILRMLAEGVPIVQIAENLSLNPRTVSTYKKRIKEKMNIANNADLIRFAATLPPAAPGKD